MLNNCGRWCRMSNPNRILPYSRQLIEEDDIAAVVDVLKSDYLTQGPMVGRFENALAEYCGAKYAVAFSNGTAALHAAYFAAGIGAGDEIITSPNTFAATANAALYLGAKPVFADIEPDTGNINPAQIEHKINAKTKAIVPIHYGGHPVDIDAISDIARQHSLLVIEDACHAIGAQYKGQKIGAHSDMSVFSFHPVKPITTGEGGAVTTNNPDYYAKLRLFCSHGITKDPALLEKKNAGAWFYEMQILGYNFRITDIQCALGCTQLAKIDRFIEDKKKIVAKYQQAFADDPRIAIPFEKSFARSSWHLVAARLQGALTAKRREIFDALRAAGLWVQVHYIPVYWHPYYRKLGFAPGLCPEAENLYAAEISLPVFPGMTEDETQYVIQTIKDVLARYE